VITKIIFLIEFFHDLIGHLVLLKGVAPELADANEDIILLTQSFARN